ncbi:MAG: hypothetical protein ABT00_07045 [Bordetella sp. SCN 68-11]|nr:MAG: hypothetical protein ABT00_07045 [Bordetella sp. SCN 68-11]
MPSASARLKKGHSSRRLPSVSENWCSRTGNTLSTATDWKPFLRAHSISAMAPSTSCSATSAEPIRRPGYFCSRLRMDRL